MKILARLKETIKAFFQKEPPPEYEVTQFVISDRQPITGASKISFFVNNPEPDASVTRSRCSLACNFEFYSIIQLNSKEIIKQNLHLNFKFSLESSTTFIQLTLYK